MRTEDLKVQKAWNGISTERQGSSGLWVAEFPFAGCLLKGILFLLHFSCGVGSMTGDPSVQLWALNNLGSLWALCLSCTGWARIGNEGTNLGKVGKTHEAVIRCTLT